MMKAAAAKDDYFTSHVRDFANYPSSSEIEQKSTGVPHVEPTDDWVKMRMQDQLNLNAAESSEASSSEYLTMRDMKGVTVTQCLKDMVEAKEAIENHRPRAGEPGSLAHAVKQEAVGGRVKEWLDKTPEASDMGMGDTLCGFVEVGYELCDMSSECIGR